MIELAECMGRILVMLLQLGSPLHSLRLQKTSPAQDGSAHIRDILVSVLSGGIKGRLAVKLLFMATPKTLINARCKQGLRECKPCAKAAQFCMFNTYIM